MTLNLVDLQERLCDYVSLIPKEIAELIKQNEQTFSNFFNSSNSKLYDGKKGIYSLQTLKRKGK